MQIGRITKGFCGAGRTAVRPYGRFVSLITGGTGVLPVINYGQDGHKSPTAALTSPGR